MSSVNATQAGSSNVLDQLALKPKAPEEKLGKDAFLRLMVAQLEHQDPLSPQDNAEFVSQLAQFSTVEGLGNLNTTVNGMAAAMRSSSVLQASALVGRSVRVPADRTVFDGEHAVFGNAVLDSAAANLHVTVLDATGAPVRTLPLGTRAAGNVAFAWDGANDAGQALPPGRYQFRADSGTGDAKKQYQVELGANVDSVTIGTSGEVVLNVSGIGPVPISDVREIR